jgi:hypothetical protein
LWDELERCLRIGFAERLKQEGQVSKENVGMFLDADFAEVTIVFVHLDLSAMVKLAPV